MANFLPLNNYMLYIVEKLIIKYHLSPPFLDVGCGSGYLSDFLSSRGWHGKAIDISKTAIKIAKSNLGKDKNIKIEEKDVNDESEQFKTIIMIDVLEHIKDDLKTFKKIYTLLKPKGYFIIGSPSNPNEWRWDDDFYGHYRRYTVQELKTKLKEANLHPIVFWDYTFPFFWAMRRMYTRFRKPKTRISHNKKKRTEISSFTNAWDVVGVSKFLNSANFLWFPLYWVQFLLFRKLHSIGSGIFVLAQKKN